MPKPRPASGQVHSVEGSSSIPSTGLGRFGPLNRGTLFTQVYEELRRGLSGGMFVPGEPVTLRQLAESFGTSIMPVREAVSRLIAERALVMLPNRRVIVPEMTRKRFLDLTELRRLIEPAAAKRAAPRIGTRDVAQLEMLNAKLLERVAARDVPGGLVLNRDFHFAIYRASQSEAFLHAIDNLWLQVGPFLHLSMTSPDMPWTTRHHGQILQALAKNDADGAAEGVSADIVETARHLLEHLSFAEDVDATR
jgi:DNA-binding GntR family transcriptional regulator